jgi:hypothetical protein
VAGGSAILEHIGRSHVLLNNDLHAVSQHATQHAIFQISQLSLRALMRSMGDEEKQRFVEVAAGKAKVYPSMPQYTPLHPNVPPPQKRAFPKIDRNCNSRCHLGSCPCLYRLAVGDVGGHFTLSPLARLSCFYLGEVLCSPNWWVLYCDSVYYLTGAHVHTQR